ncbi:MAG TPA: PEP-CTERM sorting domain-containing protein [Candidatus Sulfotelmatobacter sp.]|nr:PEP-CTERM sorting domain-containing protein [Candidatus Sulfotelmatobacter sp.]
MHFKHLYLVPVMLSLATVARAQDFNGQLGASEVLPGTGSFSDASLTLDAINYVGGTNGTFIVVPLGTEVTAYSTTISNLTSELEPISISNFLEIGTAGQFGSDGTSPPNRFDFNLQSLEEYQYDPATSQSEFIGYGTLIDTQAGGYAPSEAELEINFLNANNYSFTLDTVPEPATFTLLLAGIGMFPLFRRKS